MKKICDTLMPRYEETWIYKAREFIKYFIINIGIFKSFGFIASIIISLQLLQVVSTLYNALLLKTITLGEYEASIISTCLFLMVICYYELYCFDNIIKWIFKND